MGFNIIAETNKKLDYGQLHKLIYSTSLNFDLIPMEGLGPNGGDAMGISVPLKNVNDLTWIQLKRIIKILKSKFGCDVYDLYGGQKLNLFNLGAFKKNFFIK